MSPLYVYTLFDTRTGHPRCTGLRSGDKTIVFDLFKPGTGKSIGKIFSDIEYIKNYITDASEKRPVVISDFKSHLKEFKFEIRHRPYDIYDIHLPDLSSKVYDIELEVIPKILEKMVSKTPKEYQKVLANAAVVYQDLENKGLYLNYSKREVKWQQKVLTGRSSTKGFNIQGHTEHDRIRPINGGEHDVLIHFDWICADIRAASLLSGDTRLQQSFDISDPYNVMMDHINTTSNDRLTRDECKNYLLKSINSMDVYSDALTCVYPQLGKWVAKCSSVINNENQNERYLETVLGRRFNVAHVDKPLAVFNATMQGTVAHAMQNTIRNIWDKLPQKLIAEIHDSLIVSSGPDSGEIKATIEMIAQIMMYPFKGLLPDNPVFPVKVSIGKRWKQWRAFKIFRSSGVQYVSQEETATSDIPHESESEETGSTETKKVDQETDEQAIVGQF